MDLKVIAVSCIILKNFYTKRKARKEGEIYEEFQLINLHSKTCDKEFSLYKNMTDAIAEFFCTNYLMTLTGLRT